MNHNIELEYSDFINKNSITNYIPLHYIQLFLIILVPIIIYIVDVISNINNSIFSMPSPIPSVVSSSPPLVQHKNKKNKNYKNYKKGNFKK